MVSSVSKTEDEEITCGCTKMRKKKQKNCRESVNQDRMRKFVWASPRNMTEWPEWEARKLENGEWRLEPEGDAEVPEIIIVSDAVEGTPVDLDGKKPSRAGRSNALEKRKRDAQ